MIQSKGNRVSLTTQSLFSSFIADLALSLQANGTCTKGFHCFVHQKRNMSVTIFDVWYNLMQCGFLLKVQCQIITITILVIVLNYQDVLSVHIYFLNIAEQPYPPILNKCNHIVLPIRTLQTILKMGPDATTKPQMKRIPHSELGHHWKHYYLAAMQVDWGIDWLRNVELPSGLFFYRG